MSKGVLLLWIGCSGNVRPQPGGETVVVHNELHPPLPNIGMGDSYKDLDIVGDVTLDNSSVLIIDEGVRFGPVGRGRLTIEASCAVHIAPGGELSARNGGVIRFSGAGPIEILGGSVGTSGGTIETIRGAEMVVDGSEPNDHLGTRVGSSIWGDFGTAKVRLKGKITVAHGVVTASGPWVVEPGTEVLFATASGLSHRGLFVANGTATQPVTFRVESKPERNHD